MAFTNTLGRYASFGIMTSLPEEIVDSFWYIIDNNLKGVFELRPVLKFEIINHQGREDGLSTTCDAMDDQYGAGTFLLP